MCEIMAVDEKILQSLKSAMMYLENSAIALDKKDEKLLADSIWHVAAELEYALFLLSIKMQNEISVLKPKSNLESKKVDVDSMMVDVKNLLNEAEMSVLNGRLHNAYKSAMLQGIVYLRLRKTLPKRNENKSYSSSEIFFSFTVRVSSVPITLK